MLSEYKTSSTVLHEAYGDFSKGKLHFLLRTCRNRCNALRECINRKLTKGLLAAC